MFDRQQTQPIKPPHRDLIHNASIMKPLGRFVNSFNIADFVFLIAIYLYQFISDKACAGLGKC